MDDWLMLPRPGPRQGVVVITFENRPALAGPKPIPFTKLAKAFTYRKPKTMKVRPEFDPEAATMGPWS